MTGRISFLLLFICNLFAYLVETHNMHSGTIREANLFHCFSDVDHFLAQLLCLRTTALDWSEFSEINTERWDLTSVESQSSLKIKVPENWRRNCVVLLENCFKTIITGENCNNVVSLLDSSLITKIPTCHVGKQTSDPLWIWCTGCDCIFLYCLYLWLRSMRCKSTRLASCLVFLVYGLNVNIDMTQHHWMTCVCTRVVSHFPTGCE